MRGRALTVSLAALSLAACKQTTSPPAPPAQLRSLPSPERIARTHTVDAPVPLAPQPIEQDSLAYVHTESAPVDHLERARQLKATGEFEDAVIQARCAIFHDPEDDEALAILGKLAERTRDLSLGIEALERLAAVRREDPAPLIQLARLQMATKNFEAARQTGTRAIERDPENPEGYQVTGRAYLAKGELSAAISTFKRALEISPDHGYVLNNLGLTYLLASQNREALETLSRAAELLPEVAYVQNNLGIALERLGYPEEAKEAYARAMMLSPEYLKPQLNAKRVEEAEDASEAIAGTARSTHPGCPEVPIPEDD